MSRAVAYRVERRIAWLCVDNPPVNALSQAVRRGLLQGLRRAARERCRLIIIHCAGRTFIAGADIRELGRGTLSPSLPAVTRAIAASPVPVLAALKGNALGGGLEVAMAAHWRIAATRATRLGLPEVNLGLLPGSGGTQRLPRLVGAANALQMIAFGRPIDAGRALEWGLIDEICDGGAQGDNFDKRLADNAGRWLGKPPHPIAQAPAAAPPGDWVAAALAELPRRARQMPSVPAIAELVQLATKAPLDEGLAAERRAFLRCRRSPQSAALRHLFLAEGRARRGLAAAPPRNLQRAAVIGAGTMGRGIATALAASGLQVALYDNNKDNLQRAIDGIKSSLGKLAGLPEPAHSGMLPEPGCDRVSYVQEARQKPISEKQFMHLYMGTCIKPGDDHDLAQADLAIEAVFEDRDIKAEVFKRLGKLCSEHCIIASNTSYLDIESLARHLPHPERFLGLHFFSPADRTRLLEVVRTAATSDQTLASAMALARQMRKVAVLAAPHPGFIGNRLYSRYKDEFNMLLLEGASPAQIDQAMTKWGMAMGPAAVNDMAGLDIAYKARRAAGIAPCSAPEHALPDALVESGRSGRKSGSGYYDYRDQKPEESAKTTQLSTDLAQKFAITRRPATAITDDEIVERLTLCLANEGALLLEAGTSQQSSDIDLTFVHGYGFPATRGGPMHHATRQGLPALHTKLTAWHRRTARPAWHPAPLITTHARTKTPLP